MSQSHIQSYSKTSTPTEATASAELKLYQLFIFSVPIFFTFILLFIFYLLYLRYRRQLTDQSSLRWIQALLQTRDDISRREMGLKKEHREMLPIIVFKQSFSVKDTQCSICLTDYHAEERLQQIPACGHTFHMDCIDVWLATHTTCPLCRLSLIASAKASTEPSDNPPPSGSAENGDETITSHDQIENQSSCEGRRPCISQESSLHVKEEDLA